MEMINSTLRYSLYNGVIMGFMGYFCQEIQNVEVILGDMEVFRDR
jgi:hypothetical protein